MTLLCSNLHTYRTHARVALVFSVPYLMLECTVSDSAVLERSSLMAGATHDICARPLTPY
eukprot:20798-Eustigmatos_ZCMA.PRE.1